MIEEMKEKEGRIREEEELMKSAVTFSNEEWNKLGLFAWMVTNKEEFIKTKSEEYFQNHFEDMENNNKREDENEKEEEGKKSREEEERKIRADGEEILGLKEINQPTSDDENSS